MIRRPDQARRRFILVGIAVPVVMSAIAAIVQTALLPRLPETVAIHWSMTGEADGFGPAWSFPVLTLALGAGLSVILGVTALASERAARRAHVRTGAAGGQTRFLGALVLGTVTFLSVLPTALVITQATAVEPDVPMVGAPLLGGLAAGVVAGIAGWFAQPAAAREDVPSDPVDPLPLGADESAVWARTATTSLVPSVLLVAASLLVLGIGAWLVATGEGSGWISLALGVVLTLLVAGGLVYRVVVDDTGLTVRGIVGLPRWRVAPHDIRDAEVVFVNPVGEFGGWGWRWTPGRFGIVTRAGEAIQVTKRDGKQFVVTVDDAEMGAALLQAVVERTQA